MTDERRQDERFELVARVELRRGGQAEKFAAINISAGGVLLRNDHDVEFSIGEKIRVHFDAPELTSAFSIEATVVRVVAATGKPGVLAAMWTSSDASASAALGQMLWNLRPATAP